MVNNGEYMVNSGEYMVNSGRYMVNIWFMYGEWVIERVSMTPWFP